MYSILVNLELWYTLNVFLFQVSHEGLLNPDEEEEDDTEGEDGFVGPHHRMSTGPDGTVVHHIVENIELHQPKVEPMSANEELD